jgi:hypothetical protein
LKKVYTVQQNATLNHTPGGPRQQPHDRQRRDALAASGFTDYAERRTRNEIEADSIDNAHSGFVSDELGRELFDTKRDVIQDRGACTSRPF